MAESRCAVIVTISTAAALVAVFVLAYGLRGEREQTKRRALTEHAATLESENALLRDHLRLSTALNEELLKQQIDADFAARVAAGPVNGFTQTLRSLHVYGSLVRTPYTPPTIGGAGV